VNHNYAASVIQFSGIIPGNVRECSPEIPWLAEKKIRKKTFFDAEIIKKLIHQNASI